MILTPNPKLRMVAGPNGSGKSTLFNHLRRAVTFPLGYCLNPDDIDRELTRAGRLYLGAWGLELDDAALAAFAAGHGLSTRLSGPMPSVTDNALVVGDGYRPGYFASIFSDLLRRQWMAREESFTFETVMSHPDRVGLLAEARRQGYRTYLYYICTDSSVINADRIASRVAQGGHDVPAAARDERYARSLALLPQAIRESTRAYLFDNSGQSHRLIAEYEEARLVRAADNLPGWFVQGVLDAPPSNRTRKPRRPSR